jgi:holo-[acyl-carrier protein] synthase
VILPIALPTSLEHQSSRPQGLILDTPYRPTPATDGSLDVRAGSTRLIEEMSTIVDDLDGQLCEISISHDGDFATAVALVPSAGKPRAAVASVTA